MTDGNWERLSEELTSEVDLGEWEGDETEGAKKGDGIPGSRNRLSKGTEICILRLWKWEKISQSQPQSLAPPF